MLKMDKRHRMLGYTKRDFSTEFNSEEQKMIIRGYAILFEEPTTIYDLFESYTETIKRGALDNTDLSNVFLLYNHEYRNVLGHSGTNLRLEVDDTGLFYEVELPNTTLARDIYALVESRNYLGKENAGSILDGNSFGFYSADPVRAGKRDITKIDILDEISIVARPAYEAACSVASRQMKSEIEKMERAEADKELKERLKILERL